jgi:hypothetical protein
MRLGGEADRRSNRHSDPDANHRRNAHRDAGRRVHADAGPDSHARATVGPARPEGTVRTKQCRIRLADQL